MRSRKGLCLPMQVKYDRNTAGLPRDCRAGVNHVKIVSAPCMREWGTTYGKWPCQSRNFVSEGASTTPLNSFSIGRPDCSLLIPILVYNCNCMNAALTLPLTFMWTLPTSYEVGPRRKGGCHMSELPHRMSAHFPRIFWD